MLAKIDCLIINDEEVFELTGERNLVRGVQKIQEMGPSIIAPKKGEHGCLLFADQKVFSAPAFPMAEVIDPTGAGDTFAGGFMGYIAQQDSIGLRNAQTRGDSWQRGGFVHLRGIRPRPNCAYTS